MYHYIEDKNYLKRVKSVCCDIINQLVQSINREKKLYVEAYLIGSGAKNLITQNASEPIDLDFNLKILKYYQYRPNDCRNIKEYIRKKFNKILNHNHWSDCQDSTSALTTEQRVFNNGNLTPFSIDLGIIGFHDGNYYRLIHQKTGCTSSDFYFWNIVRDSSALPKKVETIKKEGYWNELRERYLEKKNFYLQRQDHNHPSFIVYIEAVNEIWYSHVEHVHAAYGFCNPYAAFPRNIFRI